MAEFEPVGKRAKRTPASSYSPRGPSGKANQTYIDESCEEASTENGDTLALEALATRSKPVDGAARGSLESLLGHDFSKVRIHDGAEASKSARKLGASAFTLGNDIFFDEGRYSPHTAAGRELLTHELVHVVQQAEASLDTGGLEVDSPNSEAEREASTWSRGTPIRTPSRNSVSLRYRAAVPHRIQRQIYGPPAATGGGNDFDMFMLQFSALENAAIADGYGVTQRITAFRKIFYDSASPARTYAGATVGGGAWNILIPGAASTSLPPSWTGGTSGLSGAVRYLRDHQVISIGGSQVDMGHVLAGMDAGAHPTSISLAAGTIRFRSNKEASTFIGDLGQVVAEYIHGSTASFRDTAMVRSSVLDTYYDRFASVPDMAGNVDAYALTLDASKTLSQNLIDYYTAATGGARRRYTAFAAAIGLGSLSGSTFAGDSPAFRSALREEVFNSALAYDAAHGWNADVVNVLSDPGPGIFTPTFWEMYWNVSGWTVDIFVSKLAVAASHE